MDIREMAAMLRLLTQEAEAAKGTMDSVTEHAADAISELESIRQDSEEVSGELDEYISNLAGLNDTIEKAERVADDAQNQNLTI